MLTSSDDGTTTGSPTGTSTTESVTATTSSSAGETTASETTTAETGQGPECGNAAQEPGEACDDGNQVDGDGCEADCSHTPVCGNMIVEAGEACDDGNNEDGDECSADCMSATPTQVCGDGAVQAPEACDDGNLDSGDGCEPDCTVTQPECGNGVKEVGEQCDDGNVVDGGPGDFCLTNCTPYFPPQCHAPADYVVCDESINLTDKNNKTNALKAIGICNDQPNNSIQVTDFVFDAAANSNTWQVARGFGSYMYDHDNNANSPNQLLYSPREGGAFLMLSTGTISAPNGQGIVSHPPNSQGNVGDNSNSDDDALPAPFKVELGSNDGLGSTPFLNCDNGVPDGDRDCSDTLQAQWTLSESNPNDRIYFTFKTTVPQGTFGYTFDFVFCSAEWPTWVETSYNDLLIAYQVDPTPDDPNANPPIDPYSGNVTVIPNPNNPAGALPLTITSLNLYFAGPGYTYEEPQLQGTGFEQHACSDWLTVKGGVQPGAEITIGFYLADMADGTYATLALLDNFRWDCEGCIPSEIGDCGVQLN
ncbi:choice-of-anchor L domain-containing protein [Nannocystis sp. ncelm1]|uniref:Choice-of-anchor L domain-containing protein n=1 Tax=Nannocystis radixulma TaxID=2995305 RepID=A0ABT5B3Q5_9BACT|nr:choice-of-anchor L domain-containing protein [Nannocystis radixulma]